MFAFNFTLVLVFLSFMVYAWLMKALFFDRIASIRQQRQERLSAIQMETDAILQKAQSLQQTLQARELALDSELAQAAAEAEKLAKQNAADKLHAARAQKAKQLDAHQQELNAWKANTLAELEAQKEPLLQGISRSLGLDNLLVHS